VSNSYIGVCLLKQPAKPTHFADFLGARRGT
jgi:hypothetical protein